MVKQVIEGELLTPVPKIQDKGITMDWPDAMRQIKNGKKVTRISWANKDYCFLKGEWLSIFRQGQTKTWLINDGDVEGQDWIVVNEPN